MRWKEEFGNDAKSISETMKKNGVYPSIFFASTPSQQRVPAPPSPPNQGISISHPWPPCSRTLRVLVCGPGHWIYRPALLPVAHISTLIEKWYKAGQTFSTSPGCENFLSIIGPNSGCSSQANRTGAVANPSSKSAPAGLPKSAADTV